MSDLACEDLELGQSLGQPANAQTDWADSGAAEDLKKARNNRCFSFTNRLPPAASDDVTEPTPSKLSLPAASLPQPREAANDGCQTDKASASSGLTFTHALPPAATHDAKEPSSAKPPNDPASDAREASNDSHQGERDSAAADTEARAATGTQQAGIHDAAERSEFSALYELYDSESLILNSLSLCSPGTQELVPIPAQPGPSVAHGMFANMLPESDEQHSMLSSSACAAPELGRPCEAAAEGDVEAAQRYSKHGMFANMLPQPDEQHRRFSSSAGVPSEVDEPKLGADTEQLPNKAPGSSKREALPETAGVRAEEPSEAHRATATGISRRELFRQKLAAAQAAQLDRFSPELVVPSPEAAPKVSAAHDQDTSRPRIGTDTYGVLAPSAQAAAVLPESRSLQARAADDEEGAPAEQVEGADSKIDRKETDLPPLMQGLSSEAAAPSGSNQLDESAQDVASAGAPREDSRRTTSEPGEATPDQAGLPDQAAWDSDAAVQWAENAAAGESNMPDEALGFTSCRMFAAARENAPSPAAAHSAVCRSPVAFQDERLYRRDVKGEGAEPEVEDSVSSTGSEAECSGMPRDAAADDDTAVHWAVNAANVDAAALDGDEPDEVLELAVRRMSAAVRASAPAAAQEHSASSCTSLAGASSSEDLPSSAESDKEADLAEQSSRHSGSDSGCSAVDAPNEAAEGTETAVHWAENAASSDAVAQDDQEPDEALLQAIRRMSAVAREQVKDGPQEYPAAESAHAAPHLDHAGYGNHSGGQQGMAQQSRSANPAFLPSLQHALGSTQSPISVSEPGTEQPGNATLSEAYWGSAPRTGSGQGSCAMQAGQHTLHKKQSGCVFEESCEQGPDAGQAGQSSGSPAGASYEQLLMRFKGSPAPDRCFTPPPGFGAQAVIGQDTGERSPVSLETN